MKMTKTSLTRNLDKLCSKIVRSVGECQYCGCPEYSKLHCAHIYTRKWRSVRWDLLNMICLCASCHLSFHDKPVEFQEFVVQYLGEVKYQELKIRANTNKKWTEQEMYEYYKALKTQNDQDF